MHDSQGEAMSMQSAGARFRAALNEETPLQVMGAITAYEVHGIGQLVDVPLFTVQVSNIDRRSSSILAYRFSGRVQQRPQGAGGLAHARGQLDDREVAVHQAAEK